jgi:alpha-beta hydrolase superfamily lysophospholipase
VRTEQLDLTGSDGRLVPTYHWTQDRDVKAVVQIVHGMAEHAARYTPLALALASAGHAVLAHDQRGHGRNIRSPGDEGHFADEGGWALVQGDVEAVRRFGSEAHPGAPICLLGHSGGSFVAQSVVAARPDAYQGLVLSGSRIGGGPLVALGRILARLERLRQGRRGRSALLEAMSFGAYNKAFAPVRTRSDWLSRDAAVVDAYVADPLCGFRSTNQLWIDQLDALARINTGAALARFPRDLPIYLIAGSRDPVSGGGRKVVALIDAFRRAGISNVTHEIFSGARHEVFNETNRDEVFGKLIGWLDLHFRGAARPSESPGNAAKLAASLEGASSPGAV